jgi:hypothetical protein
MTTEVAASHRSQRFKRRLLANSETRDVNGRGCATSEGTDLPFIEFFIEYHNADEKRN